MEKVVYEFDKGNQEVVRASVSDFTGKKRADLRIYFQTGDGAWHPTKRGVSLTVDMVEELQKAVAKLAEAAN
jgi:hypothetical protein